MRRLSVLILLLCVACPVMAANQKPAENADVILWRGDASIVRAEELLTSRKYAESLDILEAIIRRNIRHSDAHVYSAIAWYHLGNMDKADESIKNALAIDRGHMGAYVMAGLIALQRGDRNQAEYYLGALRMICQGEGCIEYITLNRKLRETK